MGEAKGWKDFVEEFLAQRKWATGHEIVPLAGDASNRQYFRIRLTGADRPSIVLMRKNQGEEFKRSEEAVSVHGQGPPGDPFILVARFLKKSGLPVPDLYQTREDGSLILQEDLGDQTLFSRLAVHPEEEERLTESVLRLLVALQGLSWSGEMEWLEDKRYTADLIRWEFEHFLEYGLRSADPATLAGLREKIDHESKILAGSFPSVLVHRDYHSRNLMVREDGSLGLIDFQDLLLGSPFYDVASFLFDPYRNLSTEKIERWTRFYCDLALEKKILPKQTTLDDCLVALFHHAFQRNLKACGRFFYIADVKGNPSFLGSVSGTHRNLERLAGKVPELGDFHEQIRPFLRRPDPL